MKRPIKVYLGIPLNRRVVLERYSISVYQYMILGLLFLSLKDKYIADALGTTSQSIKNCMTRIYKRYRVQTRKFVNKRLYLVNRLKGHYPEEHLNQLKQQVIELEKGWK